MSDLGAVVAYLSALAEQDGQFTPRVNDVVFTYAARPHIPNRMVRSEELDRLSTVDYLHTEESLMREGGMWIVGTIDGVSYRWPIRERRIELYPLRAQGVAALPMAGPWHLTPGLFDQHDLERLALGTDIWLTSDPAPPEADVGEEQSEADIPDELRKFIDEYLQAASLPELPIYDLSPDETVEPHIDLTPGFYLERHPYELNRASALKLWRNQLLDDTALGALYGDRDMTLHESDASILSPLPLNATQRQAIRNSRRNVVSVVSGPPGTGKSHLVAAAAIDQIAAGRSVLVASQSVHARDVVIDLLERYPMVEALKFGDDSSARRLGDKLATGVETSVEGSEFIDVLKRCRELEDGIDEHRERIAHRIEELAGFEEALVRRHDVPLWLAARDFDSIDIDQVRSATENVDAQGMLGWFRRRAARKTLQSQLGDKALANLSSLPDAFEAIAADQLVSAIAGRNLGLDDLWEDLDRREERWRQSIGDLLEVERRDRASKKNRRALQELATALRQSTLVRRAHLTRIGDRFLEVAPLWVGTLGEIEAVLPIEPGLFDLVILDEASQISQVSAAPALARAKRAMVVGDSRQLRHISFISQAVQDEAASRFDIPESLRSRLDDRSNSIFDAATAVAPVVELNEHFRSAPHIIAFSDREFYERHLHLMTQHPRNEARDAIRVMTVDGTRDDERVVRAEVDKVVQLVRELMQSSSESIGVLSPFRPQADALEAALIENFHIDEITAHRLSVGTVHSFQGTERDHIIISTGLGTDDRRALGFLEDPSLFNVMVTRAREHVTVVTSLNAASAGNGLLGSYLRHAEEPPLLRRQDLTADGWAARIANDLAAQTDARVITHYEVAGETIDIVVGTGEDAFGIETEIHPKGTAHHIERRMALQRAGWDIVILHRASCYGREEEVIAELITRAQRLSLETPRSF